MTLIHIRGAFPHRGNRERVEPQTPRVSLPQAGLRPSGSNDGSDFHSSAHPQQSEAKNLFFGLYAGTGRGIGEHRPRLAF